MTREEWDQLSDHEKWHRFSEAHCQIEQYLSEMGRAAERLNRAKRELDDPGLHESTYFSSIGASGGAKRS